MLSLRGSYKKAVSVLCAVVLVVSISGASTRHAKKSTTKNTSSSSKTSKSVKSSSRTTKSTKTSASRGKKGKHAKAASRKRGQQAISSDRTREIQEALIREHYLSGEPSGVWDQETKNALMKLQEENGWQTKIVPDSRALIKLGLGPSHDGLLNPDSAALSTPKELGVEREIPGGAMPHK